VEAQVEQEEAEEAEAAAMSEDEVEEVAPPLQSSAAAADTLEGGDVQISAASGARPSIVAMRCPVSPNAALCCTGLLPEHLPHQRALCPLHPFHATERLVAAPVDGNEAACPNCYCLICDARVSECGHWRGGDAPAHCNAHSSSSLWRQKRINAKRQRTRAVRAAQASVDPQLAQPSRSGLRSGLG